MVKLIRVPAMSEALREVSERVVKNHETGKKTVIFCEDNLTLVLENTVAEALGGGLFDPFVYSFSQFLSLFGSGRESVLTPQGSAMVMRRIIEQSKGELSCFKRLATPGAAAAVYDTISLLYSSHVDVEDLKGRDFRSALLKRKMGDICLLYEKYFAYLEEKAVRDKNTYLSMLPYVLRESGVLMSEEGLRSDVIFVGFQSFSYTASLTLSVCMARGATTYGVLIGGDEPLYTNEAEGAFLSCAENTGSVGRRGVDEGTRARLKTPEAEALLSRLFNTRTFGAAPVKTDKVHIFEAADTEEELRYVAAKIKELTSKGERYRNISLMMPDIDSFRPLISRVFSEYGIPYYIDGRLPLTASPVCSFIMDLFSCRVGRYFPSDVDAVVSNPLFRLESEEKQSEEDPGDVSIGPSGPAPLEKSRGRHRDEYRNFAARLCGFRGGALREPDEAMCEEFGFDYAAVRAVRERLVKLVSFIPSSGTGDDFFRAVKSILTEVGAEKRLFEIGASFEDRLPAEAGLYKRAYDEAMGVVDEAASLLMGDRVDAKDFLKLLKSGFYADKVSLIPQKLDAVFVGDISKTVNIGTNHLFAAALTNAVPCAENDTAVLTDRDINEIERVSSQLSDEKSEALMKEEGLKKGIGARITPKLSAVNERYRETAALNLCSFTKGLYISFPLRLGGKDEAVQSELISYVRATFCEKSGAPLKVSNMAEECRDKNFVAFLGSERNGAMRLLFSSDKAVSGTARAFLEAKGRRGDVERASREDGKKEFVSRGEEIFLKGGSVSPTTLEDWFGCPYEAFMEKGLGLTRRLSSRDSALDVGNFVHAVLQKVFAPPVVFKASDEKLVVRKADEESEKLMSRPPYSSLLFQKSGQYTAAKLKEEAAEVCLGAFSQLINSDFKVAAAEQNCRLDLGGGVKIYGKIDRIDESLDGSVVRVIDYKTGSIYADRTKYFMGEKLQLELYLSAAAEGRTPAGAYYFPASVGYSKEDEDGGVFPLTGFMNGERVFLEMSDSTLKGMDKGAKSVYLDKATLGKYYGGCIEGEYFPDFLKYARLVARQGAEEMKKGFIYPTPAKDKCRYCAYFGLCGYRERTNGAPRDIETMPAKEISAIAALGDIPDGKKEGGPEKGEKL